MNKAPGIILGVGILLIMISNGGHVPVIGTIGLFLFIVGMPLVFIQIRNHEKKQIIDEINNGLKTLNFTDEEIQERQEQLHTKSKGELKSIRNDVRNEIHKKERNNFLKK